ncbi:putative cytochrome c oxidase subunit 3, partial [Chlamydia psittaci 09DC77]
MMTRYRTRKHLSRTSHDTRSKKPSIWHSPIHYLRNLLLYRVLLSILPLKPS